MKRKRALLISLAFAIVPAANWAQTCDMLSYDVDDARSRLQRAAGANDLREGKDLAGRAKSALEGASMAAMDCKCNMAYSEFDAAAARSRRARDASDGEEFLENLNRAIKSYSAAVEAIRQCAAQRWQ